jgi:uncharacterized membrane protein YoaK (UPF0700 family)
MSEPAHNSTGIPAILLAMTAVTGVVDAVSFLALGRVFTANMTGNIVLLGFAIGGAPGLSVSRSLLALICFGIGAVIGGRLTRWLDGSRWAVCGLCVESVLLLSAATMSLAFTPPHEGSTRKVQAVIAVTAVAMGIRNAVVRKIGVPDLTTTVLTLTLTGLAADSVFAGGENPRWQRRGTAILTMLGGAAVGAAMLHRSVALPLFACGVMTAMGALAGLWIQSRGKSK